MEQIVRSVQVGNGACSERLIVEPEDLCDAGGELGRFVFGLAWLTLLAVLLSSVVPMIAGRMPPQSKMSVSPMPRRTVKITYHDKGTKKPHAQGDGPRGRPARMSEKSRGISTRATIPATKPRRIAPSLRIHLCRREACLS
jgi:hypothetical protein